MRFSRIVAPTVKELLIQQLENLILSGELPVGTRLPSERELAEQMKISKTAVHASITDMVRKGFLRVVPHKGVYVDDYAENGTLESLTSIMHYNGGRLDERNVRSLFEIRYAIESICISRVIARREPAVLERLEAMTREAEALTAIPDEVDYTALGTLYFRFHHCICAASGNTIAPMICNAFRVPSVTFWANSARTLGLSESVGRLKKFCDCISRGDESGALLHLKGITDSPCEIVRDREA